MTNRTMSSDSKSRVGHVVNHLDNRAISWHYWLDVLPDGGALVDECGIIRHVNEFLMKMTGYARDELVGQAVEILVPSPYRRTHVGHRGDFSRNSSTRQLGTNANLDLVRHDGSELAIDVALVPIQLDEKPWVFARFAMRPNEERRSALVASPNN